MVFLVAACGGTASPTGAGGAGTNPPAAATALATPGATTTVGGGGDASWCLNTTEEVEAALAVNVAQAVGTGNPGYGGGCLYNGADGVPVYALSVVTAEGAVATFNAAKAAQGAVTVDGVGDAAVLISPQGPFAVLKGATFISISGFGAIMEDATAFRVAMETLGKAAVTRLP